MTKLRSIDLSFNPITKICGLDNVPDLRELKLIGCHIREIENLERCTRIEHLYLRGNKLCDISDTLQSLRHLRVLDLEGNLIACVNNIHSCTSLTTLNLSLNKLTKITVSP